MPYSRTATSYPTELFRLIDQVSDGAVATKVFESEKQARGQRSRWYQFLGALKRDANNPPAWVNKVEAVERAKKAMAIEVSLSGKTLTFRCRDTGPSSSVWGGMEITYPETKAPKTLTKGEQSALDELNRKLKE